MAERYYRQYVRNNRRMGSNDRARSSNREGKTVDVPAQLSQAQAGPRFSWKRKKPWQRSKGRQLCCRRSANARYLGNRSSERTHEECSITTQRLTRGIPGIERSPAVAPRVCVKQAV